MFRRILILLGTILLIHWVRIPRSISDMRLSQWVIERNSYLSISGSSNVSPFVCEIREYLPFDTLNAFFDASQRRWLFQKSYLQIPVKRFDCNAKFMTEEFCKTLKADQCPALVIKFVSIEWGDATLNLSSIKTNLEISLAGTSKKLSIPVQLKKTDKNSIHLKGSCPLTFADFNLIPPQKLAGMVKVRQEIMVNFELSFKTI